MIDGQVALWYCRVMVPEYELYSSEIEAAEQAVFMEEYEQGSILGVQYSNGQAIAAEHWISYKEAREAFEATIIGYRKSPRKKESTRRIIDPFKSLPLSVDSKEPFWLGK